MDLETIKKLIAKHTLGHAEIIVKTMTAERYYENKNDILLKPKPDDSEVDNPLRSADNRVPRNFYGLLVNQKAAYMFTAPPLFDTVNKEANQIIADTLGDSYARNCQELCVNASHAGIGWLHYWLDADGEFQYGVVDSKQIIPIWSTRLNKELIAVLRVYKDIDDDGKTFDVYEYWTDVECWAYKKTADDSGAAVITAYELFADFADAGVSSAANQLTHNLGRVPFIAFPNNKVAMSDLDNVKALIDTFDKVYSGFANDLEDIQEIIFLLTNYDGTDLKEFLSDLKKYKTIKMQSSGADDRSGLETLTIDIPIEAREKLLDMTRKAIFEQGQGVDPQPQEFGNASGVALKYLYSLLELKAGLMETEFRLGFGQLVRAICQAKNIAVKSIMQTWTRTAIANDAELATICKDSVGIISNKTIMKNHPFVENAEEEEKQLTKEKEQQQSEMDQYKSMYGNTGGDLNAK